MQNLRQRYWKSGANTLPPDTSVGVCTSITPTNLSKKPTSAKTGHYEEGRLHVLQKKQLSARRLCCYSAICNPGEFTPGSNNGGDGY
jgi:hypothetical protein